MNIKMLLSRSDADIVDVQLCGNLVMMQRPEFIKNEYSF